MAAEEIPSIPHGTRFTYLNEGAANIVYRIQVTPSSPQPSLLDEYGDGTPPPSEIESDIDVENHNGVDLQLFENKLLRLRKQLPTTLPVARSQEGWKRVIAPFFRPDQLVHQSLIRLGPHLIDDLNESLVDWEHRPAANRQSRPSRRKGTYLAADEFGLLITDMSAASPDETVVEFKPKWLAQSPSAPKNSVRCRQCARFARSNAELSRKHEPLQKSWCPLELAAQKGRRLAEIIFPPETFDKMYPRFDAWLSKNTLLPRLRQMQMSLDPVGVLRNDKSNEKFRAAMTLRDCTVFVRFCSTSDLGSGAEFVPDRAGDRRIEARLGDLDLKSPSKAQYWKDTENSLIDEGWYTGTEKKEDRQPLTCQLSPKREDTIREFLLSNS
ncbi:hypothetical protein L207DRAFT_346892 [Hyaloscypha variabilis F]|uniref:Inositol-pentakisphosphate 2-kinase n=1 Tax=Hyaloscypha variabilis (strain UAMH 11265 / GT02V1 / F) TaxID=1149755 RepID=A0A2J6RQU0_HYAVF|nr:hypothetical protein L207DRAFT_346892 [Hyaloscypha variabilis F]